MTEPNIPRPEYPRPQFMRPEWLCLNGEWQFEFDPGDSGLERGLCERELTKKIQVPFCPESELSGIGDMDFHAAVWYRKEVIIPKGWIGRSVLLHFQAVDYDATVWVNGVEVGRHRGGFTSFTCNLSGLASPDTNAVIVVRARDGHSTPTPRGKQSNLYENYGCMYTRTTGIWQTVWLEPVPESHLERPRLTPNLAQSNLLVEQPLAKALPGMQVEVILRDHTGVITSDRVPVGLDFTPSIELSIPNERLHAWEPGNPFLYELEISLLGTDGTVIDRAASYAGMRSIAIAGKKILLNGKPLFQRLVLDQGYYPDGILTAPTDKALQRDIELSQKAGFNGARLHQKVFEERFLYHADRLGYILWGEFPDWGCGGFGPKEDHQQPGATYITQWLEAIQRDYSHPSVVGWCPLNETWQVITDNISVLDDVTRGMFLAAKALDTTRPVLDTSGYSHRVPEADIYDSHDYTQELELFRATHGTRPHFSPWLNSGDNGNWSIPYSGQPYMVSEFGGIWWNPDAKEGEASWGYGNRPTSLEEFYQRFDALCSILLENPAFFGYCYTQLTDVFQEQNGIYKFDRSAKFDLERIRNAQHKIAAIEG